MAGGNNKKFMKDPVTFIRTHQIMVNANPAGASVLPAGNADIDLVSIDPRNPEFIRLEDFTRRKHGWVGAKPVKAFFLPGVHNNTSTLNINTARSYMFTADLSGCLFAAYGADASAVTVEHVNVRDKKALVPILPRAQNIIAANHAFYKILSPVAIPGADANHVKVYAANSSVVGILTGGSWRFHYKPAMTTVAML